MTARKFGMHSLHVKNNTVGTSNEISFSVLDAKKQRQDAANQPKHGNPLGKVALFSLPGKKKIKGAPKREEGLPLSSGEFASAAVEHDPTGTVSLGSNAISGGTGTSGFTEDFTGSAVGSATAPRRSKARATDISAVHTASPEKKQQRARTTRRVGVVGLACLIIAAAAVGVYSLARGYYEGYLLNQSYQQVLTSSLSEVVEADDILSEMDASFSDMLSDESLAAMKSVQEKLPTARQHLSNAETLVKRVQSSLTDEKDVQAAQNTLAAIEARRSMLTLGSSMVEQALAVDQQCNELSDVWNNLLAADASVRQLVSAFSALDSDSVAQTKTGAETARSEFKQAKTELASLKKQYPELALSDYTAYIEIRIEALDHLIAACEAIEAEDVDLATTESDEYNSCDSRAVSQANSFTSDITTLATDPFFEKVDEFKGQYNELLTEAASLDTELREYLRSTSS